MPYVSDVVELQSDDTHVLISINFTRLIGIFNTRIMVIVTLEHAFYNQHRIRGIRPARLTFFCVECTKAAPSDESDERLLRTERCPASS